MALTEAEKIYSRAASKRYYIKNREQVKARAAAYRAANPEKIVAYSKAYSETNKEVLAAKAQAYRQENPEKARDVMRKHDALPHRRVRHKHLTPEQKARRVESVLAYKARNPEKVAAAARAYKEKNRDKINVHKQNRRARKNAAGGRLSHGIRAKLMTLQRGKCAECAADLKQTGSHLDHIMPLALGGAHEDANIQLLCPDCNRRKNAKDPIAWAQLNGRLL